MIFLIEYDRHRGMVEKLQSFHANERSLAEKIRLETELDHNRYGVSREVVLLDAADEEALRRTHGRYFENVQELWTDCGTAVLRGSR